MTSLRHLIFISSLWALIVLAPAFGFFWIHYRIMQFGEVREKINMTRASLEERRQDARRTALFLKDRAEDFDRVRNFFIPRERPVEFIEELEDMSRVFGTTLLLSIDETQEKEDPLTFRLMIRGEELALRKILQAIESLPYGITIQNISFRREPASSGTRSRPPESASLHIDMKVYTF